MVIHGAVVPYLLRSPDNVRREEIRIWRKQIWEQKKNSYWWRKENISMLEEHISEAESQIGSPGGWTLIGDAYIEGVMHGEALEGLDDLAFERIAIV